MHRTSFTRPVGPTPPTAGPVTRGLLATLVAVSLLGAVLDRHYGLGSAWLVFDRQAILHGQVWRLLTYGLVRVGSPVGLLFSGVALWLFGAPFERRWGSARYARFCVLSLTVAALVAVPLGEAIAALGLFADRDVFGGPDAIIDALLVVLTLEAPDSPVLFGFLLPLRARTFLSLLLGLEVASGLMTGVASLGLTLGGMASGYLWATGLWRPEVWATRLRLWRLRRRRQGLFVVPPPRGGYRGGSKPGGRLN